MKTDFSLRGAVDSLRRAMPDGNVVLGSNTKYFKSANAASLTWAAKVNIVIRDYVKDEQRHKVLSALVNRPIKSTKDLLVAEAAAIWNSRKNPALAQFIRKVVND
jgi:hypothetical protein